MRRIVLMAAAIMAQLYYFFKNYLTRIKLKRLINLISGMTALTPNQLLKKIQQARQQKVFQLCKAKIYASEPCKAVLNPSLQVVYSSLFEGQFMHSPSKNNLLRITEPSYMKLKQGTNTIKLYETHKSVILPTKVIQFKAPNFLKRIINTVKDVFQRSKEDGKLKFSDFYNHENVYELFLPEGSQCTVLGNFAQQGKQVVCNKPKMIFQNEKQMISFIEQQIKSMKVVNILLTIGFVLCTILLLKEIYRIIKGYRTKLKDRSIFGNIRRIFQRSRVCMICNKNLSCFLNLKCQHMIVCEDCVVKTGSPCLECDQKECEYVEMYAC